MPCTLKEYPGCAKNRKKKLLRAIDSFIEQDYPYKELIIISDGCQKTMEVVNCNYYHDAVKCYYIKKKPQFSGLVRQEGLEKAKGDIICYLDSDDYLFNKHLSTIAQPENWIEGIQWIIMNDIIKESDSKYYGRLVVPIHGSIGTSSIAHLRSVKLHWQSGYGHDWTTIEKYLLKLPYKHIGIGHYVVCHIPSLNIDN